MADPAWDGYSHSRKSPNTRRAGEGYADPDYQLARDWITRLKPYAPLDRLTARTA
jgi:hypothetical protein